MQREPNTPSWLTLLDDLDFIEIIRARLEAGAVFMVRLSAVALVAGTAFTVVEWSKTGAFTRIDGNQPVSMAIATHDTTPFQNDGDPALTVKSEDRVPTRGTPVRLAKVRSAAHGRDIDPIIVGSLGASDRTGELQTGAVAVAGGAAQSAVFHSLQVIDGRTFRADGLTIRLSGVALPEPDEMCKLINGKEQSCRERAETRLDLLTRHRPVSCRYTATTRADEAVGTCRIGKHDLAETLIKSGWVKPVSGSADQTAWLPDADRR